MNRSAWREKRYLLGNVRGLLHSVGPAYFLLLMCFIVLLISANFILIWRQLHYGLEFDEAINLTVVRNFAEGNGYSSNFGSVSQYFTFDPIVSTGPAVLVPGSLVWSLSGGNLWVVRLVPVAFYLAYLLFTYLVIARIRTRQAAIVALSAPLLLVVGRFDLLNESLLPGRFIGEIPAVAFTMAMVYLLLKSHTFLAGLAGGLAIASKFNWALAIGIISAVFLLYEARTRSKYFVNSLSRLVAGLVVPILLMELFRVSQVGVAGYIGSIGDFVQWLSTQGRGVVSLELANSEVSLPLRLINTVSNPSIADRLNAFYQLLSPWGLLLVLGAIAFWALVHSRESYSRETTSPSRWAALAITIASVASLTWWLLFAGQGSSRLGLPVWLMLGPLALGSAYAAIHQQCVLEDGRSGSTRCRFLFTAFLSLALLVQAKDIYAERFGEQLLRDQQLAADALLRSGSPSVPATAIWTNPELQLITGLPSAASTQAPRATVQVMSSIEAYFSTGRLDALGFEEYCLASQFSSSSVLICRQLSLP